MAIKHLVPRSKKEIKKILNNIECDECRKKGNDIKTVRIHRFLLAEIFLCKSCRKKCVYVKVV